MHNIIIQNNINMFSDTSFYTETYNKFKFISFLNEYNKLIIKIIIVPMYSSNLILILLI